MERGERFGVEREGGRRIGARGRAADRRGRVTCGSERGVRVRRRWEGDVRRGRGAMYEGGTTNEKKVTLSLFFSSRDNHCNVSFCRMDTLNQHVECADISTHKLWYTCSLLLF